MDPLLLQIVARLDSNQREFDLLKEDIFAYIHSTAVPAVPLIDTPPVASTTIDQATATLPVADQLDQNQLTVPTDGDGADDASNSASTNTVDQNAQIKPQTTNATEQVADGSNDQAIREPHAEQELADLANQPSTSTGRKRKLPSTQSGGRNHKKRAKSSKRKFTCSTVGCGRSFDYDKDLARHERIHLGTKPFACTWPGCGKSFRQRCQSVKHIRVAHFELPETAKQQHELNMLDERDPNEYIRVDTTMLNRHQS